MESQGNYYNCEICSQSDLNTEAELLAHKKLHQTKSKAGSVSLQCAYCNEHCKSRSDLENHMKVHHISTGKGKHKCNICDEIFFSSITLADHKLSHCKIVGGNTCTQCKVVVSDEQTFYSHQLQHSNASVNKSNVQISLPANCIICCQTLQSEVEVKLHTKFHLKNLFQKEFVCTLCNKKCDNRSSAKNSSNVSTPICKDCADDVTGNSFASLPAETKDLSQNSMKPYSCLKCPSVFSSETEVQAHKTAHLFSENNSWDCHLCRNGLPNSHALQIHLIEHNFMGMGHYRCYICSSVFTTSAGLLSHMVAHGPNSKPYECTECKAKFYFKSELENHRLNHIMLMGTYKICKFCSGFFLESNLPDHHEICPYKVNAKVEKNSCADFPNSKVNEKCRIKNLTDDNPVDVAPDDNAPRQ